MNSWGTTALSVLSTWRRDSRAAQTDKPLAELEWKLCTIGNRSPHHCKVPSPDIGGTHGDRVDDDTDGQTEHLGPVQLAVFLFQVSWARACTKYVWGSQCTHVTKVADTVEDKARKDVRGRSQEQSDGGVVPQRGEDSGEKVAYCISDSSPNV